MTKGKRTRQRIIRAALPLFSTKGYSGTSIDDILNDVGLQKGGLYGHFRSKDELALAAFDYAFDRATQHLVGALEEERHAAHRLGAAADAFIHMTRDDTFSAGCHVLNTAIDSDDTHPALRRRVMHALERWRAMIRAEAEAGIASGELVSSLDPDELATLFISTLEGSIMLTKVYDDPLFLERAVAHLKHHVTTFTR